MKRLFFPEQEIMRTTVLCLLLAGSASAGQLRLLPEKALRWKPPTFEEADLHPRILFLKPEWERMDVWVPKGGEGPLPCVVIIYGGGYGEKNMPIKDWRPLLKRGFVVAAPDYSLGSATPVPLCSWDVANAIRFLRANAKAYRIDPERIGIWGWSAGGWIAQDLCYAGPERLVRAAMKGLDRKKTHVLLPMLEPRPQYPEQSVRGQVVVSDWGAGKPWDRRKKTPVAWLTADDPPLFTCYSGELTDETVNPVTLLKKLGVPAKGVYGMGKSTHVPDLRTPCVTEDGTKTTWGESIYAFLDAVLKQIDRATAPEMIPHRGLIAGETSGRADGADVLEFALPRNEMCGLSLRRGESVGMALYIGIPDKGAISLFEPWRLFDSTLEADAPGLAGAE